MISDINKYRISQFYGELNTNNISAANKPHKKTARKIVWSIPLRARIQLLIIVNTFITAT
jgi:predicted HAD superfamily phosphohydrolase YqeG